MFIKPSESNATLLLFIIIGLGYIVTYIFEWGYLTFFGLPSSLIFIYWPAVLKNVLFLAGLFSIFYILNFFISRLFNWLFSKKKFSFRQHLKFAPKRKKHFISFLAIIIFTAVSMFFFIYKAMMEPGQLQYIYIALALAVVLYQFSDKKYATISSVLFLVFFSIMVYFFGYNSASAQVEYLVVSQTKNDENRPEEELIVIRSFGSKAIVARADLQKKIISQEYQLVILESAPNKVKFKPIHTGKLQVNKPAADNQ